MIVLKAVLCGESGVGKTSFFLRAFGEPFNKNVAATIGVDMRPFEYDEEITLNLWDTAGQERYGSLKGMYFNNTAMYFFCYDTSDMKSLERIVSYWMVECNWNNVQKDGKAVGFLVACKTDIAPVDEVAREIATFYHLTILESSASRNDNSCRIAVEQAIIVLRTAYKIVYEELKKDPINASEPIDLEPLYDPETYTEAEKKPKNKKSCHC